MKDRFAPNFPSDGEIAKNESAYSPTGALCGIRTRASAPAHHLQTANAARVAKAPADKRLMVKPYGLAAMAMAAAVSATVATSLACSARRQGRLRPHGHA
jgi:hypothetical protein